MLLLVSSGPYNSRLVQYLLVFAQEQKFGVRLRDPSTMALMLSVIQDVGLLAEESMTLVIHILHDLWSSSPILDPQRVIYPSATMIEIIEMIRIGIVI